MDLGLKDKVAIVAGASKGLGRAVAESLAAEGCKLAVCSRREESIEATAGEIASEFGVEVLPLAVDLSQAGAGERFVDATLERFGGLDVLVTNNGGPPAGTFADFGREDWLKAVELTLLPALDMVRQALPSLAQSGQGRIINMTSISVKQPIANLMLSNSIRSAVTGWAKTLAGEVGPKGITVNNVLPGYIQTERVGQILEHRAASGGISLEETMAAVTDSIPLGRLGQPKEFGDLVAFLASARAGYITGANYWIDGGLFQGML